MFADGQRHSKGNATQRGQIVEGQNKANFFEQVANGRLDRFSITQNSTAG
jgi:hypothetical protein